VARYFPATATTAFACIGFILLFTPTGSLPSARWRWWAIITAATPIALLPAVALLPGPADQAYRRPESPFDLPGFTGALLVAYRAAFAIILLAVVVAAGSLVARFRRARGVERQQLRWVALAAALVGLLFVAMVILVVIGVPALPDPGVVSTVALVILTFGISAAILRYRLYDLDRIISRALSYGLLTVLLGGGYAGLVLGLGGLVGRRSNLVVALATLAVAAIFQPARRRIQQAVDRRFNRRRYGAARTTQSFSARLRQELDLDALTVEALAVVDQTMQPTQASLWLRPHPGRPGSELVESSPPVPPSEEPPVTTVQPIRINGTTIFVEVDQPPPVSGVPGAPGGPQGSLEDLDDVVERLGDVGDSLRTTCTALYNAMRDATAELKPDGIELQFGVKLGGEMGVPFVAKGTSEANFSIKLTWAPDNV
jgi:hypothetical protein